MAFFCKVKRNTSEERGSLLQKTKMMKGGGEGHAENIKEEEKLKKRRGRLATKCVEREYIFGKSYSSWNMFTPHF